MIMAKTIFLLMLLPVLGLLFAQLCIGIGHWLFEPKRGCDDESHV